jgi:hypothetical protein
VTGPSNATPWSRLLHLAALGALTMTLIVLWDVGRTGTHPANLIQPGAQGPAAELVLQDFPDIELADGLGLDGQQYYAMARAGLDLDAAAPSLDRPIYRWQRPLFPWLARVVHPGGSGGAGLVAALFVVGIAALFLGGIAAGAFSTALGGGPWPAAVLPLLPGAWMSLRVTMADALGLALVLVALALSLRRRPALAVAAGCLAVLSRETAIVVLVGWAIAHRSRATALLAAVPLVVAAGWAVWLRVALPSDRPEKVDELGLPFVGLVGAIRTHWLAGTNRLGMLSTALALALAIEALRRADRRHPLVPALWCNLAFTSLMNSNVIGLDFGATRSMFPLTACALVTLATRHARVETRPPLHLVVGIAGPSLASGAPANR